MNSYSNYSALKRITKLRSELLIVSGKLKNPKNSMELDGALRIMTRVILRLEKLHNDSVKEKADAAIELAKRRGNIICQPITQTSKLEPFDYNAFDDSEKVVDILSRMRKR